MGKILENFSYSSFLYFYQKIDDEEMYGQNSYKVRLFPLRKRREKQAWETIEKGNVSGRIQTCAARAYMISGR